MANISDFIDKNGKLSSSNGPEKKKFDANRAVQIYKDMRRRMRTGLHGILGFSLRQTNNKTKPAHEIHIYFSI